MKGEKFEDYCEALGANWGDKMKQRILDHAANNRSISLAQLMWLVRLAYPD